MSWQRDKAREAVAIHQQRCKEAFARDAGVGPADILWTCWNYHHEVGCLHAAQERLRLLEAEEKANEPANDTDRAEQQA